MRAPFAGIALLEVFLASGCANPVADLVKSNRDLEEHKGAECRRWEERANNAANPDAATIALHSRLTSKIAEMNARAVSLSGPGLDAAIRKIAQAQIEADALFDANDKRKAAAECWEGLAMIRDMHGQMMRRLGQEADQMAAASRSQQQWTPVDSSIYTLHTQPPSPPSPVPVPDLALVPPARPNADTVPQSPELGAYVGTVPGGPNVYVIPPGAGQ